MKKKKLTKAQLNKLSEESGRIFRAMLKRAVVLIDGDRRMRNMKKRYDAIVATMMKNEGINSPPSRSSRPR